MQITSETRYLADLDDQLKALDDRETALEASYKAEKAKIAAQRDELAGARKHFMSYLARSQGEGAPAQSSLLPGRESEIPLPSRIGDQHRMMLEALDHAPEGLRPKEISRQTGVQVKVIYTFAQRDAEAGIVGRVDNRFVLTEGGRDFMKRARTKFGPAPKLKAPQAEAGGALQ